MLYVPYSETWLIWTADDYTPIDLIDHLKEWLRITPGGRKCWNITLQDDGTFDLQGRNTYEQLHLWFDFYNAFRSIRHSYARVVVVDNERGNKNLSN